MCAPPQNKNDPSIAADNYLNEELKIILADELKAVITEIHEL